MHHHATATLRVARTAAAVVVLAIGAAACSSAPDVADDPEQALDDAIHAMADHDGVSVELSLDTTGDDLVAIDEHVGAAGEPLSRDAADLIAGASLRADLAFDGEEAAVAAHVDGSDVVEVITEADAAHLRVDVDRIADITGVGDEEMMELQMGAGMMLGAIGFPVETLFDGEWITVTGIEELEELADEETADDLDEAALREAAEDALDQLWENVDVVYEGSDDHGERIRATVTMGDLADSLAPIQDAAMGATPGGDALVEPDTPGVDELDDQDLHVDVWLDGGEMARVAVDLTQLWEWEGQEPLPDDVTFAVAAEFADYDGVPAPPESSAEWDLAQMVEMLEGMFAPPEMDGGEFDMDDGADDGADLGFTDEVPEEPAEEQDLGLADDGWAYMAAEDILASARFDDIPAGDGFDDVAAWETTVREWNALGDALSVEVHADGDRVELIEVVDDADGSQACLDFRAAANLDEVDVAGCP